MGEFARAILVVLLGQPLFGICSAHSWSQPFSGWLSNAAALVVLQVQQDGTTFKGSFEGSVPVRAWCPARQPGSKPRTAFACSPMFPTTPCLLKSSTCHCCVSLLHHAEGGLLPVQQKWPRFEWRVQPQAVGADSGHCGCVGAQGNAHNHL